MNVLDEGEMRTFLDAAKDGIYFPMFLLTLSTGLRRSELVGLQWGGLDLDLLTLSVNRSLHQLQGGEIIVKAPKTARARRLVALPPSAALSLRQHREQQDALRADLGLPTLGDDDWVFGRMDGSPMRPDSVTHAWRKLARRLGMGKVRLHDARHTHATIMLAQGIHPKIVQERLGHASVVITLDTYSHVLPGLQEAAALAFDRSLREPAAVLAGRH